MSDRVVMQVWDSQSKQFGPVVYGHWAGDKAGEIAQRLKSRMGARKDWMYASARLVQEMIIDDADGCLGFGIYNTDRLLNESDLNDCRVILIDAASGYSAHEFV